MASRKNKKSRTFISGKALSEDFRQSVCDDLIANGAPANNVTFPGLHTLTGRTADKFRIDKKSVIKYWTQLCAEGNVKPKRQGGNKKLKLCDQALGLIEFYILDNPSITVKEIKRKLEDDGLIDQNEVCDTTIRNALKKHLSATQTHKKTTTNNSRRFTAENLAYTQAYMDELYSRDPDRLKFFDEAGFCPVSNHPTYGWSERGIRCVQVARYAENPHYTLNLMIETKGITYSNVEEGATNCEQFLDFFWPSITTIK